jgi:hypothetical protein
MAALRKIAVIELVQISTLLMTTVGQLRPLRYQDSDLYNAGVKKEDIFAPNQ